MPSGSASTCQDASAGWPMSTSLAPARQEALELGVLIAVGGVDVDVQPGVPVLRLVAADEDDRRLRAAEPFARAYLDEDLLFAIELCEVQDLAA